MSPKEKKDKCYEHAKAQIRTLVTEELQFIKLRSNVVNEGNCSESCENIFGMTLDRNFFPNFFEFSIFDQECLTFCLFFDAKLASKTKFLGKY